METKEQPNNPLHGKTLESILKDLVEIYGWELMGEKLRIRCFLDKPTIPSSLKFLRKTDWARKKVETMWVRLQSK